MENEVSYHVWIDRRSLAMHRLIADKIRREPRLFDKPVQNVERWARMSKHEPYYLTEWRAILATGMEGALNFATEDSERGARLRQSTPFAGVLTPDERLAFLKQWKEANLRNAPSAQ